MFKRILAGIFAILMLSACTPSKQYEGSKNDGAFFTVPNGWQKVNGAVLSKVEAKDANQAELERLAMVTYQVGFSKAKKIAPKEIFLLEPTNQPVLYVRIRDLFPEERNAISLNTLRNLVMPVTDYLDGTIPNDRKFELFDDQEIQESGARGVSLLYSFDYNGVSETVNQIALMSNNQDKIYVFIIRCSTECYDKNIDEIAEIANSFTVRGAK